MGDVSPPRCPATAGPSAPTQSKKTISFDQGIVHFFASLQLRPYYLAELIIGSVSLAILVAMLIWFLTSIRRSRQDGRVW